MLITLTFVKRFTMPNVDGNTDDTDWTYSRRTPITFAHTLRTTVSYP